MLIKGVIDVLQPFNAATEELSAEKYVSASKIIPLTKCLLGFLINHENLCPNVKTLKCVLKKNLDKRMGNYEYNHHFQLATYLDPRFKQLCVPDSQIVSMKKYITSSIKQQQPLTDIEDEEVNMLLNEPTSSSSSTITLYSSFNSDDDQNRFSNSNLWNSFQDKVEEHKKNLFLKMSILTLK